MLARYRAGKHAAALAILDSYHTDADYESLDNYAPKLSAAYSCALAAKGAGQDQAHSSNCSGPRRSSSRLVGAASAATRLAWLHRCATSGGS